MPPVWPPVTLTHPTLVARPFHHEGWIYEEKYDGWRLVGYKRDGQVWLLSRHHRDHTRRFPALAAAIAALKRLRADGAGYLVIPQVALWWLDHYAGLREHLDRHGRVVVRNERTAVIYALDRSETSR